MKITLPTWKPLVILAMLSCYLVVVVVRSILSDGAIDGVSATSTLVSISLGFVVFAFPAISTPMSLVIMFLAGRSELGSFWTGSTDVTFLIIFGFVVLAFTRLIELNGSSGSFLLNIHPIVIGSAIFSFLYTMQFVTSSQTDYAIDKAIRVSGFAFLMVVITAQLMADQSTMRRFMLYYITVIGAMSSLALMLAIYRFGILGIQRITPLGGGPITLARFTGFAALICIAAYLEKGKTRYLAGFGYFVMLTLMTGSRGPLVSVLATIAVLFGFIMCVRAIRHRAGRLVGFLTVSLVGLTIAFLIAVLSGVPFANRYVILFTQQGGGASTELRSSWIAEAGHFVLQAPFWGNGVASWPLLIGSSSAVAYPHNLMAELVVENGILGLTLFSIVVLVAIMQGVMLLSGASTPAAFSAAFACTGLMVFSILGAQMSGDLFDNRYVWIAFGWIAAVSTQVAHGSTLEVRGSQPEGMANREAFKLSENAVPNWRLQYDSKA